MDFSILKNCTLCPRECRTDRTAGKLGYCRASDQLKVARAALHMWEEPCISGEEGSGTVFFTGCALGCVYCQNRQISKGSAGKVITIERLADIFLELQKMGANNINLVTPSHYVLHIIEALDISKRKGLTLPVVYNCSGYEKTETLKLLEGYVDIYLPDFKYMSEEPAIKYSNCKNYFPIAAKAVEEMVRQVSETQFDDRGIMQKGVIVRHLTLPGYLEDSKRIVKYLYETYKDRIFLSIMNQYTPIVKNTPYPELNRRITEEEYEELIDYAIDIGVENGFIQEGETASESFIPVFNGEGV
ncbi:MAG: radical SAM protein [Clostridiaceae bacterium]|jgi:putative pyruvate formate lyase activating enzyme|nr:radical SAM protein [Clostridiaceae bacterium]